MSSIEKMGAMENMFDPEQTTVTLLEAVKANVAKTVKTVDAAASLENKLSEEAAQFNACLTTMSNAIRKCERGEISREEMLAECAPCVAALKEKCVALKLADVKTTGDDITEDEIAMLREYIVGCKDIVADRKQELQDCPVACEGEVEGILAGLSNFEPATEASLYKEIRKGVEAKTATQLYKQAKKLYGLGSKGKALEYLKKAQALYEKCLDKAKEAGKVYEVERTTKAKSYNYSQEDKFTREVTDNYSLATLIEYFEDRIDSCKALELQWNNKAGKSTYKETKAQLKAERKEARAEMKAAKKAEREAKKAEKEGAVESMIDGMSISEFIDAMESYADTIEAELALEAALEAEGIDEEVSTKSASGLTARFRAAFGKMKKAKVEEKSSDAAAAAKEISAAAADLEDAVDEAETPEEKKKLSKGAKAAIAVGASVAAAAGLVAIASKARKLAESPNPDAKGIAKLLAGLGNKLKAADVKMGETRVGQKVSGKITAHYMAKNLKIRDRQELADKIEQIKQSGGDPEWTKQAIADVKKAFKAQKAGANESFLSSLAFGLEGVMVEDEDVDDDKTEPAEGKAFDDDDLMEEATEAAIAVMMAEDGIDDSDLD